MKRKKIGYASENWVKVLLKPTHYNLAYGLRASFLLHNRICECEFIFMNSECVRVCEGSYSCTVHTIHANCGSFIVHFK